MKGKILTGAFSIMALFFVACGSQTQDSTDPGTEVNSDKQRITDPSSDDVPDLVAGNTEFALDMYKELAEEPGNLFFSPHSISVALAMTWAGARANTEAQMASTLHFDLGQDKLHQAFDWLDLALNSRGQDAEGKDGEAFRLNVINRLFGQVNYQFLDEFLDTLALYYGAGMHLLDFATDPDSARLVINQWVSDQTNERIENLIPEGSVDDMTKLVLVNAIYFNAAWKEVFDDKLTSDGVFHKLDGTEVTVPMMVQPKSMPFAQSEDWQAVDLAYDGDELSMVVIVPQVDFSDFEQSLDSEKIHAILSSLGGDYVTLTMPRFTIDGTTISLRKFLTDMGMPDAFVSGVADFSGMDGSDFLFIGDVLHQAFVSVDEYGTEAAAATAVVMEGSGMPRHLDVNKPFIFLIRDMETNAIVFMGRVLDPA